MAEALPPLIATITANIAGYTTAMQQVNKETQAMVDTTETHTSRFAGLFTNLKSMIGPAAVAVAGFVAAMGIKKVVDESVTAFEDYAGAVRQFQRITGGSVEEASGLAGAMKLVGLSAEDTTTTFTVFSKRLEAASQDADKTAEMTAKLGTNFLDANGNMRPMSELLPGIADKFASMPNGIEKTALAAELFGRSGTSLLPILNKGSAGIEELTQKAGEMGLVLDDAAMDKFAKAKQASREWDATIQGLQITIGEALMPILEGLKVTIQKYLIPIIEKATQYVHDHQKQFDDLGKQIEEMVKPIMEELTQKVLPALVKAFEKIMPVVGYIIEKLLPVLLDIITNIIEYLVDNPDFMGDATQSMEDFKKVVDVLIAPLQFIDDILKQINQNSKTAASNVAAAEAAGKTAVNYLQAQGQVGSWSGTYQSSSLGSGYIPGQADGGMTIRGGLSWVGERGPELLNLPAGAQVIPLEGNSPSLGDTNITVYAETNASPYQIASSVGWQLRLMG